MSSIELHLPDYGITLNTFRSYSFASNFLTPCDAFSLTIGDDSSGDELLKKLLPGIECSLSVDGKTQATGFVEEVTINSSRDAGTEISIEGTDVLGPVVASDMNPKVNFIPTKTVFDVISQVFGDFGFTSITEDPDADRDLKTGLNRSSRVSRRTGKLKKFTLSHQLKPYEGEGCFSFCARVAQRRGLWIWASADGANIIVGKPDFTQAARYKLVHKRNGGASNNVLQSSVTRSASDQPSIIVARGYTGTGDLKYGQLHAYGVNPSVEDNGQLVKIISDQPGARGVQTSYPYVPFPTKFARPIYAFDGESRNLDQLELYVKRELSLRQRKALTAHYLVEGHVNEGHVWATDTVVSVDDDVSNIHEPMYVLGRTFTKSRESGTQTHLELIRLNTLDF